MTKNLFSQGARCSRGWGERCPKAKSPKCTCACAGANHGNPAAQKDAADQEARYRIPSETSDPNSIGKIIGVRGEMQGNLVYLDGAWLDPAPSIKLRNHSPDGFEWGYGGSGPSQLALAICLKLLDQEDALRIYQQFKFKVVAGLPKDGFELDLLEVQEIVSTLAENGSE